MFEEWPKTAGYRCKSPAWTQRVQLACPPHSQRSGMCMANLNVFKHIFSDTRMRTCAIAVLCYSSYLHAGELLQDISLQEEKQGPGGNGEGGGGGLPLRGEGSEQECLSLESNGSSFGPGTPVLAEKCLLARTDLTGNFSSGIR